MEQSELPATLEGVAIIGMACRFPGASDVEAFWQLLRSGREGITFFTDEELLQAGVAPEVLAQPEYVKAGVVLKDVDLFDAAFFGYAPREAEIMDPQQRLFLECAWHALEHAGYTPETCPGPVGVYTGSCDNEYILHVYAHPELAATLGENIISYGNGGDYISTRVSYKFNFKGPSVNIRSACSSSLVAVQMACQSLLNYQCDMMLAGGVTINISPQHGYTYHEGGLLSPDGHCRAFDAEARGTIFGDGLGVVVLKRVEDALLAGDTIYAVIKGGAVNNDGFAKIGFTAPSIDGPAAAIIEAQSLAQVDPETLSYIETHGLGTPLGDPIEVAALTQAFGDRIQKQGYCALGSVKTNVGHLGHASGIAGLIKTALMLHHRTLVPSLHFQQASPQINFAQSPFYVNTQTRPWPHNQSPRQAGVSSFGIGGTNAHVVLEEAPEEEAAVPDRVGGRATQLLLLSARTPLQLEQMTANLAEHLSQHPEQNLADVAYTLQIGRKRFDYRRAWICHDRESALAAIRGEDPARQIVSAGPDIDRPVIFLFPGQGSLYSGMAAGLYRDELVFRREFDHGADLLLPFLGEDLRKLLFSDSPAAAERLRQARVAQPALFLVEYALARLWGAWGIHPQMMIGDSIGEYVAACLAGVFTLEEGLQLVSLRGRLIQSEMMEPLLEEFQHEVARFTFKPPTLRYLSNVTGTWITPEQATDHAYWSRHLRETGRFAAGLETIRASVESEGAIFLEVVPGQMLTALAQQQVGQAPGYLFLSSLRCRGEEIADQTFLWQTVGQLWAAGAVIEWKEIYASEQRRRIALPGYAFERQRYWLDAPPDLRERIAWNSTRQTEQRTNEIATLQEYSRPTLQTVYVAPRTPLEQTICKVWKTFFGLQSIGVHDDFFALGGYSLLATRLMAALCEICQVNLPINKLFDAPTIAGLAQAVEELSGDKPAPTVPTDAIIDLRMEVDLDAEITPEPGAPLASFEEPAAILLTGVTGFIGPFLLHDLLQETKATIYCLVRAANRREASRRIQSHMEASLVWDERYSSRIVAVAGDLAQPLFGLSPEFFDQLARTIDVIYHNGAWVNFFYPYQTLKPANVLGTKEVLRLACKTRVKPLHYISSTAVFGLDQYNEEIIQEETPPRYNPAAAASANSYSQSKWVAEQIILQCRERGLPVTIYRLGTVAGHSRLGVSNLNDLLHRLLIGCLRFNKVPLIDEYFDMTPVDYVSKAILHLSSQKLAQGEIFHLVNPTLVSWQEIISWLVSFGYSLSQAPFSTWRAEVTDEAERSSDGDFQLLLQFMDEGAYADQQAASSALPSLRASQYSSRRTEELLKGTFIACPSIDAEFLGTCLTYLVKKGWVKAPEVSPVRIPLPV